MRNLNRLEMTIGALVLLGSVQCVGIPPCPQQLSIVRPDFSVTVVMSESATVRNTKVLLADNKGQVLAQATTDANGLAKFSKLPNGDYQMYVDIIRVGGLKRVRVDASDSQAESALRLAYVGIAPIVPLQQQPVKLWRGEIQDNEHPDKSVYRPWANIEISLRRLQDDREVANVRTSESGVFTVPTLKHGLYTVSQISHAPNNPETFVSVLMVVDIGTSFSGQQIDVNFPAHPAGACSWPPFQVGAPDLQAQLKVN